MLSLNSDGKIVLAERIPVSECVSPQVSDGIVTGTNRELDLPSLQESYRKNRETPVCRSFVKTGECIHKARCKFKHPNPITQKDRQEADREIGRCHCGSGQRIVISNRYDEPMFFVVCARTGKSMKKCIKMY